MVFHQQWQRLKQYWHCLQFGFRSGFQPLTYAAYRVLEEGDTPAENAGGLPITVQPITIWADVSAWSMASIAQGGQFYPFETASVRFTATVMEALLALPKHPELPYVQVGVVTQHISQLMGVMRYAKRAFNQATLRMQLLAQWFAVCVLPYQEALTKKRQQLETLVLLLQYADLSLRLPHSVIRFCLNGLFSLADSGFQHLQRQQLQQTPNSYGLCFGLIDLFNSPFSTLAPHQRLPMAVYCSTDFDTQLLVDGELQPLVAEILPQLLTPELVLLMPSIWHKNTFLQLFPFVPAQQVQCLPPCVDSFFRLSEAEQTGLTRFIQQTPVLKKLGIVLPEETPFFLVVLDKQQSFRWLHSVLAGFECFYDIRVAEDKLAAIGKVLSPNETALAADDNTHEVEADELSTSAVQPSLVIVGATFEELPAYQALLKETLPVALQDKVHLHGGVSATSLLALYHQALGLFYVPDEKELGLGLPILEALTMQCPVVVSKVAHLEAFAENAALFVAPQEPLQLAFAMAQLVEEQKLLRALRHNGRKRTLLQRESTFVQALLSALGIAEVPQVVANMGKPQHPSSVAKRSGIR